MPTEKQPGWSANSPGLNEECRRAEIAERILRARRLGREYFSKALFADIGWEALLDLYIREAAGTASSVADLQDLSATPISVLNRWLNLLEAEGLIRRAGFRSDVGRELIELTDKARDTLDRYLTMAGTASR